MELVKFITCNIVVLYESYKSGKSFGGYAESIRQDIMLKPMGNFPLLYFASLCFTLLHFASL